jgi:hypothetical protein
MLVLTALFTLHIPVILYGKPVQKSVGKKDERDDYMKRDEIEYTKKEKE